MLFMSALATFTYKNPVRQKEIANGHTAQGMDICTSAEFHRGYRDVSLGAASGFFLQTLNSAKGKINLEAGEKGTVQCSRCWESSHRQSAKPNSVTCQLGDNKSTTKDAQLGRNPAAISQSITGQDRNCIRDHYLCR